MSLTLAELAAAKGFTVEELAAYGIVDGTHGKDKTPCVRIPYRLPNGKVAEDKLRLELDGPRRFRWPPKKPTMAYGLDRLEHAPADTELLIVEGESDCWAAWRDGIAALGIPGAKSWRQGYAQLPPTWTVFVWREPGDAGETFAKAVAADLPDARIIHAPDDAKDSAALAALDRAAFPAQMRELMAAARSPRQDEDAARAAAASEALSSAGDLLDEPRILDRVDEYITASGYAGDTKAPLTVYTSLTSRCLRRPLNLALIASSASGKNRAIEAVLPLFPQSTYVMVKAGTPRSLVHGDHDFQHRIVIVAESDSLAQEEDSAASAIRALAADNSMEYDVVERDPDTNRWTVRHIVKPGPTGLVTTSTRPLKEQLSTRMLAIGIPDSREQTRSVLHAHADAVNGRRPPPPAERFVAAQQYLELAGVRDVVIPFGHVLADAVPDELVRMRRDFRQALTVIETHAFLHQRTRARDAAGRVVATLDDYAAARDLVGDVFTAAATGGISKVVREVVMAVEELEPGCPDGVTCTTVAAKLGLHKNTCWYRLKAALKLGLVVNSETRRGHPAKLRPGDDLPEDGEALPTVERLASLMAAHPPQTVWTVEPHAENLHQDASGAVQVAVQVPIESLVETSPSAPALTVPAAVQRFNGNPGGIGAEAEMVRAALDSGFGQFTCPSTRGCPSTDYWIRPDGEPMCSRCHPDPVALAADWERRRAEREAPMS